jgi:hypothetical protein
VSIQLRVFGSSFTPAGVGSKMLSLLASFTVVRSVSLTTNRHSSLS